MSRSGAAQREERCAMCGGRSVYAPQNRWRPFCSERCRSLDLGAWASERYRVPAPPTPDDDDRAAPDQ